MSEDVDEVAKRDPPRTAPRIVCFQADSADYLLIIEKKPVCKIKNFTQALNVWFASHYVFDLVYSKQTRDVALFFKSLCSVCLRKAAAGRPILQLI